VIFSEFSVLPYENEIEIVSLFEMAAGDTTVGSRPKGIPVAVFYEPDGSLIGNTNNKELEPSRKYSSTQILAFLKKIVTERRIVRPDKFIELRK
jgi:hypothetical protein